MQFAPQLDANFLNLAPSSLRLACLVMCPNPLPITTNPSARECIPSKFISGREYGQRAIFSGATFVLENPCKFSFTASTCWQVQSILNGGVFSCPKQMDDSAINMNAVIVLVFMRSNENKMSRRERRRASLRIDG